MSIKFIGIIIVAAAIAGVAAWASLTLVGNSSGVRYIALGDSLAVGEGATDPGQTGYVARLREFYQEEAPGLKKFDNLAVLRESSATFVGEQLAQAVEAIKEKDTSLEVVTLSLGGNDFLPLTRTEPCVSLPQGEACQVAAAEALATFAANYQAILQEITTAMAQDGGEDQILVTTCYNPFGGTGHPQEEPIKRVLLGSDGRIDCAAVSRDPWTGGLNDLIACAANTFGAKLVDLYPLFDGQAATLTRINEGDIHPNDQGHEVIARAMIEAYRSK